MSTIYQFRHCIRFSIFYWNFRRPKYSKAPVAHVLSCTNLLICSEMKHVLKNFLIFHKRITR